MSKFKYAVMLPYPTNLDYEQINDNFAFYSDELDRRMNGDRSVWCLRLTENTLTIAFKRKRDRDLFPQIIMTYDPTDPWLAGACDRSGERCSRMDERSQTNWMYSYMLCFDFLDTKQIGDLGAGASEVADIVTGDDRSAYEVWFHNNEVHVGFKHEEDRDEFARIIDEEAAEEVEAIDLPLPVAASPHQITVH